MATTCGVKTPDAHTMSVGVTGSGALITRFYDELTYVEVVVSNCTGVWVARVGGTVDRVVLYLHAGAAACSHLQSHRNLLATLTSALDASVLLIDYRTTGAGTSNPGIADAVEVYRRLIAMGYRPDQVVLAVDSAESDLATAIPRRIEELGVIGPGSVVSMSTLSGRDPDRYATSGPVRRECALLRANSLEAQWLDPECNDHPVPGAAWSHHEFGGVG